MKKISVENMSAIQGGDMCDVNRIMIASATVSLYAAPFVGPIGIGLGFIALATIALAAYSAGSACR